MYSFSGIMSLTYSTDMSGGGFDSILKSGFKSINESIQSITEQNL